MTGKKNQHWPIWSGFFFCLVVIWREKLHVISWDSLAVSTNFLSSYDLTEKIQHRPLNTLSTDHFRCCKKLRQMKIQEISDSTKDYLGRSCQSKNFHPFSKKPFVWNCWYSPKKHFSLDKRKYVHVIKINNHWFGAIFWKNVTRTVSEWVYLSFVKSKLKQPVCNNSGFYSRNDFIYAYARLRVYYWYIALSSFFNFWKF